jgi:hypothetical protein
MVKYVGFTDSRKRPTLPFIQYHYRSSRLPALHKISTRTTDTRFPAFIFLSIMYSPKLSWIFCHLRLSIWSKTGYREQLNQVTAYLDASIVYGSDVCEATKLRTFEGGQMNTTVHPGGRHLKALLPQTPSHPECKAPSGLCFEAGSKKISIRLKFNESMGKQKREESIPLLLS